MKKMVAMFLLCALLAAGAAQGEDLTSYPITFLENPTTGYEWVYTVADETVLAVEDGGFTAPAAADGMVGAGGTHRWTVTGLQAGETTVTFTYTRSWESDPGDPVVTYTFSVDAGLALTLMKAEGLPEQYMPDKAVVRLLENPTTGYTWEAEADPAGVLSLDSDFFTADETAGEMTGVGGVHTWIYSGTEEGTVILTFRYARSFEPDEKPEATVTFTYQVDAQKNVTLMGIDGDYEQYDPDAGAVEE